MKEVKETHETLTILISNFSLLAFLVRTFSQYFNYYPCVLFDPDEPEAEGRGFFRDE
jgi:hypothetical protein